jgi:hypothetical protein
MTKSHPVFGDAEVHPITGRHIEEGHGAPPRHVQLERHISEVEAEHGKERADEMRAEVAEHEAKTPAQRHAEHMQEKADEAIAAADIMVREAEEARLAAEEAEGEDPAAEGHQTENSLAALRKSEGREAEEAARAEVEAAKHRPADPVQTFTEQETV